MLTKFHEIQGPVTYFFNLIKKHGPNSSKCKNTIIMFQCKTYLNTCLVWITMLECWLVEDDMFSVFPIMDWQRKIALTFDIKFHDSYLMKCLHTNITQNDTIWWHLYLPHFVYSVKTTSNQCYTEYVTLFRMLIHTEDKPYDKSIHTGEEPYI